MRWLVAGLVLCWSNTAMAETIPYKLIITWYQSNVVVIDYPSAVRCAAARDAVLAEVARREAESAAQRTSNVTAVGASPNGAFCIPG